MELPENLSEQETREMLLKHVKKEVKQIMEEAVTRKFVHEESSSVVSLCGAVECCLQHGLKKRALGLFKNSTTMALLQKVAKCFQPAAQLVKTLNDLEKNQENSRKSVDSVPQTSLSSSSSHQYHHLAKKSCSRYLWIRIALYEKQLARIVDHLVLNSSKYYEKDALLSDPVTGAIFASLLVGPCALEFTQMKTVDHLWTDPPAKELMQRHRIHSTAGHHLPGTHSDSPKRLALQVHKTSSSTSEDCQRNIPFLAKEYVESLHQNSKSTLLYGKNNVVIQPKEDVESMAGYLSLHQSLQHHLVVKWTPNQLMNVSSEQTNENSSCDRSQYWNYALAINFDDIVYLHCHHQLESGGTVVLVGQDGVQRPPIHFPKGGHLWAFLSCIETGLAPNGHLEPPLSSHHEAEADGVFPVMLKKKIGGASNMLSSFIGSMTDELTSAFNQSQPSTPPMPNSPKNHHPLNLTTIKSFTSAKNSSSDFQNGGSEIAGKEEVVMDYVFRVVTTCKTPGAVSDAIPEQDEKSNREDSTSSVSNDDGINSISYHLSLLGPRSAVRQLCDTMSSQILSRAFYGWLSHCRQLKTVRTHLSGLVHTTPVLPDSGARVGLVKEGWEEMKKEGSIKDEMLLYRLIYFGGCEQDLRKEVWPFLLGHYKMESTEEERLEVNEEIKKEYEERVAEWSNAEDFIKSQEKDKTLSTATTTNSLNNSSSNLINNTGVVSCQKLSHVMTINNNCNTGFIRKDSSLSNEVFESVDDLPVIANTVTTTDTAAITEDCANANGDYLDHVVAPVDNADTNSDNVIGDDKPMNTSTSSSASTSTTQQHSSSSSLSSILSSSSAASNASRRLQQRPHHLTHHGHAKRMLEKSNRNNKAKFTISDDGTSLDSSDSAKLDSGWLTEVDSDNVSSSPAATATNDNHLNEVTYSAQLLENLALNLHRIDKDVHRCDRNHVYFSLQVNLNKLRNVMCTYVWNNMDMGYVQGMCDLAAPLLVILDDEALVYSCFNQFMKRMSANFPNGNAMDQHFGNMRSLIQIMDPELFEHMKQYGDYTHFYFCYRWFLLDFKRELVYSDVFRVWETIWCARHVCSPHFVLFIALALLEYYREIIIDNKMDFTEIIKFFNELAERHNANEILNIARSLVGRLQELIENK